MFARRSVHTALGGLFAAFVALVTVSVGMTFWGLNDQRQDALVINLAGRQRMLVQQMTRLALEIVAGEPEHLGELQASMDTFERTLRAFQEGGEAPYLPGRTVVLEPTRDPLIREQLERVATTWEAFRVALEQVGQQDPESPEVRQAIAQIETLSSVLVAEADAAVRLYESASTRKVERLRWIQGAFLVAALLLSALGLWQVRLWILDPLHRLGEAARRIGQGDLSTQVVEEGLAEVRALAAAIERMRVQLHAAQVRLMAWGQELERRVAQRTRELEALHRVSREISSRLDLEQVLRTITEKTRELVNSDIAVLCLLDEGGERLYLQSFSGPVAGIHDRTTSARTERVCFLLQGQEAQRCEEGTCGPACRILHEDYRRSHVVAPLRVKNQVIGALCVGSTQPGRFTAEEVDLITRLANSAAIALENARLYQQAERLAALEERQRIAAEMHDGLAQVLSTIGLLSDHTLELLAGRELDEARRTLQRLRGLTTQAVREVRQAIASLRNDAPPPRALQEELRALVTRYEGETPAALVFHSRVQDPVTLDEETLRQVLRVAEEALRNAIRHSGAQTIEVVLERDTTHWRLQVRDDGRGFLPEQLPPQHFGLQIMRARAARLEGSLHIETAPGAGTTVTLSWPAVALVMEMA